MSGKIIRIKSGNEEITMECNGRGIPEILPPVVADEEKEQRNREAMEQNGYTEESYEEWKENDMRTELFAESMEELAEKRMLLGCPAGRYGFPPAGRTGACHEGVRGGNAGQRVCKIRKNESRTTVSSRKQRVLEKLRLFFFEDRGFDVHK